MTTGTAGVEGTAVICGSGVTGVVSTTSISFAGCAGLVGAGCHAEIWGLAGACSVAIVASGTVSVGLTLHSHRCHHVQQWTMPSLVHTW